MAVDVSTQIGDHSDILFKPVGILQSVFKYKNGTPRQPHFCSHSKASLTIDKSVFNNPEHSLIGIEEYSHVWLLFYFHKNGSACTKAKISPPRLRGKKLGVFATRSPHRPSPLGLTRAKLESVSGATLYLSGVDIIDGTPILDIKPYIPSADENETSPLPVSGATINSSSDRNRCSPIFTPTSHEDGMMETCLSATTDIAPVIKTASWLRDQTLTSQLAVRFTDRALSQLHSFIPSKRASVEQPDERPYTLKLFDTVDEVKSAIIEVLSCDPRSIYRRASCSDRLYYFTVDAVHVTCWFDEDVAEVLKIQPLPTDL